MTARVESRPGFWDDRDLHRAVCDVCGAYSAWTSDRAEAERETGEHVCSDTDEAA